MAENNANQIDKLEIKVKVSGLTQKSIDNVNALTKALKELNKVVSNVNGLKKYANSLAKIAGAVKTVGSTAVAKTVGVAKAPKTEEVSPTTGVSGEMPKIATKEQAQNVSETSDKVKELNSILNESVKKLDKISSVTYIDSKGVEHTKDTYEQLNGTLKTTVVQIDGVTQSVKNQQVEAKKHTTGWSKFVKAIGRIALYRTIRRALQMITQAMKEGVTNYAKYDSDTNKALSNISNSVSQLKNTFGVTFGNIIKSLEPVITNVVNGVNDMVNGLNMAMASMNGMNGTYSKAKKLTKDWAKEQEKANSQLLSFDKFESLNAKNTEDLYEEANLAEDWNETASVFKDIVDIVKTVIEMIGELWKDIKPLIPSILNFVKTLLPILSKIVTTIMPLLVKMVSVLLEPLMQIATVVLDIVSLVIDLLTPIISSVIDVIGGALQQIAGMFEMIGAMFKLLTLDFEGFWHDTANGFASMINGIANMFIGFINFVIDNINLLIKPIDAIVRFFGGSGFQIGHWNAKVNWQPYADGGMAGIGTAMIVGEKGAEIVAQGSRGTGVTNIEQFTTAMYNALAMYGVARGSDLDFHGDVIMSERVVGQLVTPTVYQEGTRVGYFKKV